MNINILKSSAITGIGIIALGVGGTVWAEGCIDPMAAYPDPLATYEFPTDPTVVLGADSGYLIPAPSITEFDGALTCDSTSGYFGGIIPGGSGTETFISPDGLTQFTVTSAISNGIASWEVIPQDPEVGVTTVLRAVDSTISASNKGSKGCNTTFGADAVYGVTAYEKSNGTFVSSDIYVCADINSDPVGVAPPQPPPVVEGCVLQNNEIIDIYGVTIQCLGVPAGQQRTIIVAKDTGDDINGDLIADPVPGFGFVNEDGVMDFNNVCICNGPDPVGGEVTCDPSPLPDDPVTDALEPCTVIDSVPALDITIQNPYCFTYGGSRICY